MAKPYSFIAISDVHLGWKLYNQPELEQDTKDIFVRVCDKAIELKVTYLIIVGDLYDTNKPTPDLISFTKGQIDRLRSQGITVLGIAGDHDKELNGETWVSISGVERLDRVPYFAGHNYDDNPEVVLNYFRRKSYKEDVEWLFAHGQEPSLFNFTTEKKRLDFMNFPLQELYPNLRGVILGDVHRAFGKMVPFGSREIYLGYCGSLAYIKADEVGHKLGPLHFDGEKLERLPILPDRDFIVIQFTANSIETVEPFVYYEKYKNHKGKRPIFLIEYDATTRDKLTLFNQLYEVGMVKSTQKKKESEDGREQTNVNIRSELNNKDRVATVLQELCPDKELYNLVHSLLNTVEPKTVLDEFKTSKLASDKDAYKL